MRLRTAILVVPLLSLLAAPASPADPTTKAYKHIAKVRLKLLASAIDTALSPVKMGLAGSAQLYGEGTLTAADALQQAAITLLSARDVIEDAAFQAARNLQLDGLVLLLSDAVADPTADFQAGGQGVWDRTRRNIGKKMDKADRKLRKTWRAFVKDFAQAAEVQGLALDLRSQLPTHGSAFRGVAPPDAAPFVGPPGDVPLLGPQVLFVARLAESNTSDTLVLGIRAATVDADVHVASTEGEDATLGTLALDASGTALGSFALDSLAHPQGFVVVGLDDGTLSSTSIAVSAPTLAPLDPDGAVALEQFALDLKAGNKALLVSASAAVKAFEQSLSAKLGDVKSGATTPEAALTAGFGALTTARESMGLAWTDFVQSTSAKAGQALGLAGVDDSALAGDFQPDVAGLASTLQSAMLRKLDSKRAQLGKAFGGFTTKVVKSSSKSGTPVTANVVTGQGSSFSAPMVSGASTPAFLPSTSTGLVDGLTIGIPSRGTTSFTGLINVQADAGAVPSMSLSSASLPFGPSSDLGDVALSVGGTQMQQFPLSVDLGVAGFNFYGGATRSDHSSPLVLSTPTSITTP